MDPALVHHYFGTKEQVFLAAMEFPVDPSALVEQLVGDRDRIGERLARFAFALWEAPETRDRLLAMLRSAASNEEAAALLRGFAGRALVSRVAAMLDGPFPELRVEMAVSHIIGLAMARYVIRLEPIASAEPEALVGMLAPILQQHLVG